MMRTQPVSPKASNAVASRASLTSAFAVRPAEVIPITITLGKSRIAHLVGADLTPHFIPSRSGKVNKGNAGLALERQIGLENNHSRESDFTDGELKTVKMTTRKRTGMVLPSESIALGMINPEDFYTVDYTTGEMIPVEFIASHVYKKIKHVLLCGLVKDKNSNKAILGEIHDFEFSPTVNVDFYNAMKADYDLIRDIYLDGGRMTSRYGTVMQARTKGAGHGSTSRAFYWRRSAVMEIMKLAA